MSSEGPRFTAACMDPAMPPASRATALELLNTRLHPALQSAVAAEVAAGNRVSDAGADWPDPGSVHVTLRDRFGDGHANENVAFSLCDDPHYWYADYSTVDMPRHLLIC